MTDTAQTQPVFHDPAMDDSQIVKASDNTSAVSSDDSVVSSSSGSASDDQVKTNGDLNTFGDVLDEIGMVAPQAVATAINQSTDSLNPANPTRSAKEKLASSASIDSAPIDAGGGVSLVEHEKMPEIPIEVESFLHRVEDHQNQAPQEIVIADGTAETSKANYPSTPVVVLPITQDEDKEGQKKSLKFSFRWLVEWSHKVIKLFAGKAIFKE